MAMAMLLLMDTTIVAQMTDRGLAKMNSKETTDTIQSATSRLFARMALWRAGPVVRIMESAYHLRIRRREVRRRQAPADSRERRGSLSRHGDRQVDR
jgi:hypothetical protein